VGRSLDAAFKRAVDGSRKEGVVEEEEEAGEEQVEEGGDVGWKGSVGKAGVGGYEVAVGEGGTVGGCDCRLKSRMASDDAFSRI